MTSSNAEIIEAKYVSDRVERMYKSMKDDLGRHETLCFELANKFEVQNDVLL
jgi:hypothetical protein